MIKYRYIEYFLDILINKNILHKYTHNNAHDIGETILKRKCVKVYKYIFIDKTK